MGGYINRSNYKEGSLRAAEASILKSLEIEPDYADSYVLLGHLYTRMGRHADADAALDKAEMIGTKYPWLPLNRAELLMKRSQYDESLSLYKSVVESETINRKAYASALSGMTTAYRYLGQFDKADEIYKIRLENEPDNAHTWGNYSDFLLYQLGDVDGAIVNGKKALSIMNYGMGRFTLACALYTKWALLQQDADNAEEAQKYFNEAWAIYPYPERVFQKTSKHKHTQITAMELVLWKASQPTEDAVIHNEE